MFDLALVLQLFALLNPLSSFPVLMSAYKKKMDVHSIAIKSSLFAYAIALFIIFAGPQFFSLYGVNVDSFRIAGGIILLLLGIETVRPKPVRDDINEVDSTVAIIATPLLTGPAVISFLTISAIDLPISDLIASTTVAFGIVGFVFVLFSYTIPMINAKIVELLSKVMGLFLTALAIQMITAGISAIYAIPIN